VQEDVLRTGFIHGDAAAAKEMTVHAVGGGLRFGIAAHFDEPSLLNGQCRAFHHDFGAGSNTNSPDCYASLRLAPCKARLPT
jgi:hypothetical protein